MQASWSVNGSGSGVDPSDRGLAYGDGLFETMAAHDGAIRLLDYHLERLAEGCDRLRIRAPARVELRRRILAQTPAAGRAVVKLIVTRGPGARGYRPAPGARATVVVAAFPWPRERCTDPLRGIDLVTCGLRLGENPQLAGMKHLCRLEQVLAQLELSDRGAHEGLLLSTSGLVIGGTHHNVFGVFGSCVRTPRIDRCGVRGVMRRVVLEACAALDLAREEADIDLQSLQKADELFVTNAVHGARPVRSLDGAAFTIGPVTRRILARLASDAHA